MFSWFLKDEERGPIRGEVEALAVRDPFSRYLPYRAYDEEKNCYYNSDDSVGYLWECTPINFAPAKTLESLATVLSLKWPEETIIQCCLASDKNIDDLLDRYIGGKVRDVPVIKEATRRYAEHLSRGREGLKNIDGTPVRTFRLFLSIKTPDGLEKDQVVSIEEQLRSASLNPRRCPPEVLLPWLRQMINGKPDRHGYDDKKYLSKQIIQADTKIEPRPWGLKVGGRCAACLTPKLCAPQASEMDINGLIGGWRGQIDDGNQLSQAFLWTTTVFFGISDDSVKSKANKLLVQRVGGSIAKELGRRVKELDWVLEDIEESPYCNVITSLWVFGEDEDDMDRAAARVSSLWDDKKFKMQRELGNGGIADAMFIASLPFGVYTGGKKLINLKTLDRDFPMSVHAAARLLPIQADYYPHTNAKMLLLGRKGQLVPMDFSDSRAINRNFLICAGSGAGKSFFTNFMVENEYASGSLIRITDIGYSFEKQADVVGGRFIDIGDPRLKIVLNPFMSVGGGDAEDEAANRANTAAQVLAMAFSSTGTSSVTESQYSLMKAAVDFAHERDGGEYGIDHVQEYLFRYPELEKNQEALPHLRPVAQEMGFNLHDWTSKGRYGERFNGKTTLDFRNDDFVVLEMEQLLSSPELFRVVAMITINGITQDLYLADRTDPRTRFLLFDEAWKYLVQSNGASGAMTDVIGDIIQEGYRRARKYGGSMGIVTQSPLDLGKMGPAGEVVSGNSSYKNWLACDPAEWKKAVDRKILDYEGLLFDLATSVKTVPGKYSEILFDTPFGIGVGRLCADPLTYWVNTTSKKEVAEYKKLVRSGYSAYDALTKLAEAYPQGMAMAENRG